MTCARPLTLQRYVGDIGALELAKFRMQGHTSAVRCVYLRAGGWTAGGTAPASQDRHGALYLGIRHQEHRQRLGHAHLPVQAESTAETYVISCWRNATPRTLSGPSPIPTAIGRS